METSKASIGRSVCLWDFPSLSWATFENWGENVFLRDQWENVFMWLLAVASVSHLTDSCFFISFTFPE